MTMVLVALTLAMAVQTGDPATDRARTLFLEAKADYDGGRFDEALAGFHAAYAEKPLPGFLFNLGQCERQLGHHDLAVSFFERYLAEKPDAANRALVEELLAESRSQVASLAAPVPGAPVEAAVEAVVDASPPPVEVATASLAPPIAPTAEAPGAPTFPGVGVVAGAASVVVVAVGASIAVALLSPAPSLGTRSVGP